MTMSFCNYHKIYMNHVHSSSLLCQLSALWKSQTLCDAAIKTGSVVVRAHRVVLVAACPMLQSMENATAGSHLEIRVASDIKQDSINAFLQYLYEGYMMLTEENCRDVEKIARLLHVDNVLNCCADFNKCMNSSSPYKYSGQDQAEFKHVRITDLLKVQDRPSKRFQTYSGSQGVKRARMQQQNSADAFSPVGGENYSGTDESCSIPDPWERVPRSGYNYQPGVIDVRQEGIELIQTEPPADGKQRRTSAPVPAQSVSLSLSSQFNTAVDKRVVDVTKQDSNLNEKRPSSTSQNTLSFSRSRQSAPQNLSNVVDLSNMVPSTSFEIGPEVQNVHGNSELPVRTFEDTKRNSKSADIYPVSITEISRPDSQPQSALDLPYAAGNASQIPSNSSSKDTSQISEGHQQQTDIDWGPRQKTISPQYQSDNSLSVDITGDTDVSIIKVEPKEIPPPSEGPEGGLFSQPMANMNIADQVNQGQTNPVGDWSLNSFSLPGESNTSQVELSDSSVIESTQEPTIDLDKERDGVQQARRSSQDRLLSRKHIELDKGNSIVPLHAISPTFMPVSSGGAIKCTTCKMQFMNDVSLKYHICLHQQHRWTCDTCGKGFSSEQGHKLHVQRYHSESGKTFPKCKTCGKQFASDYALSIHEVIHSGKKDFNCLVCGRSFKYKSVLKSHKCIQKTWN